jgi:serine/threonine protein kinase
MGHPNLPCLRHVFINDARDELYVISSAMFSDVRRVLDRVSLSPGQAKAIFKQTLQGLAALHALGFAHRDLQPVRWLTLHAPD